MPNKPKQKEENYEQSERSHRHCFNDQEGHEKHLRCCICGVENLKETKIDDEADIQ